MRSDLNIALTSGLIGASALTLAHEVGRRILHDAPRMDILGMRALSRVIAATGEPAPQFDRLHRATLVGDLVANALYYAAVAAPTSTDTWQRGAALGAVAGIGALTLPERMGLGTPPHSESRRNQILTIAWYMLGGLAAAAAATALRRRQSADSYP